MALSHNQSVSYLICGRACFSMWDHQVSQSKKAIKHPNCLLDLTSFFWLRDAEFCHSSFWTWHCTYAITNIVRVGRIYLKKMPVYLDYLNLFKITEPKILGKLFFFKYKLSLTPLNSWYVNDVLYLFSKFLNTDLVNSIVILNPCHQIWLKYHFYFPTILSYKIIIRNIFEEFFWHSVD